MIGRLPAPIFVAMVALGMWYFAGYLMVGLVDCTGSDVISFPIRCADGSRILLVDSLKFLSVALGLSSVLLLILFWKRRSR